MTWNAATTTTLTLGAIAAFDQMTTAVGDRSTFVRVALVATRLAQVDLRIVFRKRDRDRIAGGVAATGVLARGVGAEAIAVVASNFGVATVQAEESGVDEGDAGERLGHWRTFWCGRAVKNAHMSRHFRVLTTGIGSNQNTLTAPDPA
jgi:hypothetical protein